MSSTTQSVGHACEPVIGFELTRRARRACGLTVLTSTQVFPASSPARTPVRPRCGCLEHVLTRNRGEDDVGRLCHLPWRVAPLQPVVDQLLGVLARLRAARA